MESYVRARHEAGAFRFDGLSECLLGLPVGPDRPGGRRQGTFAEWHWDGQKLVVRNDRYGFLPLYYAQTADAVMVADSLPRLLDLGAPAELDDDALAVFLRLGTFVGDDTPFRHARQLPPGAELVWTAGGAKLSTARPPTGLAAPTGHDGVAAYAGLFRQAVRRRAGLEAGRRVVLPLSGGQDSRHILLELVEQGRPPDECVTVAPEWSPKLRDDARVAADLTRMAGVRHTVLSAHDDLYALEIAKNALTNFATPEHAWILPLADHLRGTNALVYDGIAGDILSAGMLLDPARLRLYRDGRLPELADDLLGDEGACRGPLGRAFYARVGRDRAVARLVRELERHAAADNPLSRFYFWNRTRRSIAPSPYAILGRVAAVDSPYLDHDLFDFLAGLPAERLLDRSFHADAIRAAYPRFAAVPFAKGAGPLSTDPRPFRRLAGRVLRKLPGDAAMDWSLLNRGHVLPRAARALAAPRYAVEAHWLMRLSLYLGRLGALAAGKAPAPV